MELFNFKATNTDFFERRKIESIGLTHIGIKTENLGHSRSMLTNAGHQCHENKEARIGGFTYFFTSDPDGNLVEMIEEHI